MSPLIALAITLLPDLAKQLTRGADHNTQGRIIDAVRDVLGTDDPAEATRRAGDAQLAGHLRIRLAEIENEAQARLRADDLERLEVRLASQQVARSAIPGLAGGRHSLAWAPAAMSLVVTGGFFATLIFLIALIRSPDAGSAANQSVIQIVNITVGALTAAFATVVSFWLGSSEGSRLKDQSALHTQAVLAARDQVSRQSQEAAILLQQGKTGTAPPATKAKDARQFTICLEHVRGFIQSFPDAGPEVDDLALDALAARLRVGVWNALNCDSLAPGVDLVLFDTGTTVGVTEAARMLQTIVHVDQDGQIGAVTLGATQAFAPHHLISALSDARLTHYRHQPRWTGHQSACLRRTAECRTAALAMT